MKIAFVNTEFLPVPPTRGGAVEEWIERLAQGLKTDAVFIFSRDAQAAVDFEQRGHLRYFWFRPGWLSKLLLSTYRLPFQNGRSRFFFFPYALWCARQLKKVGPDIIHIHNRPHFVWIIRKLNPKAKIILHIHQVSAIVNDTSWAKALPKEVDLFLGCSQFIVNELKNRYEGIDGKAQVIYNGVDIEKFEPVWEKSERRVILRTKFNVVHDKVVLYVGRLAENKGAHLLIQAVQNVVGSGQRDLKLFICGARGYANRDVTPYIKNLYGLADGLKDRIFFTGFVPHEEIPDYYLMADVVVIPSEVAEGFCIITIEGLAAGVPVIASARGGIPEIISDNENGCLVHDVSVAGLQKALEDFLNRPEVYRGYTNAGRRMVEERFTWEKLSMRLQEIYLELV